MLLRSSPSPSSCPCQFRRGRRRPRKQHHPFSLQTTHEASARTTPGTATTTIPATYTALVTSKDIRATPRRTIPAKMHAADARAQHLSSSCAEGISLAGICSSLAGSSLTRKGVTPATIPPATANTVAEIKHVADQANISLKAL